MKRSLTITLCLLMIVGCGSSPEGIATDTPATAATIESTRIPTSKPSPTAVPSSTPIAGHFRPLSGIEDSVPGDIQRLHASRNGSLWLITDQVAAEWMDTAWRIHLSDYSGRLVGIDEAASVWMISEDTSEISVWDGFTWTVYGIDTGWTPFPEWFGQDLWGEFDTLGRFWIPTSDGIRVFNGKHWTLFAPEDMDMDPTSYEDATSGFQVNIMDSNRDVWVGGCDWAGPGPINGRGARRYDGQNWYAGDSPVASGCVTLIEEDHFGNVWIGLDSTLMRYDPLTEGWLSFPPPESSPNEPRYGYITDLGQDSSGEPWPVYMLCGGASCYVGTIAIHLQDQTWSPIIESDKFGLQRFVLDAEGTLWLFWDTTVYRINGGELEFMAELFPQQVTIDANGQVWFVAKYEGLDTLWTIEPGTERDSLGQISTPTSSTTTSMTCPPPSDKTVQISPISPGTTVIEGFEPQLLNYLNLRGSADDLQESLRGLTFNDGTTIWESKSQVINVDVTGNQVPEVLIDLSFFVEGQYVDGAIFIYRCKNERYEGGAIATIGGQTLTADDPDPGIRAVQDMNSDGVPEIVYSYIEIIGTHANFTRVFKIVTWDRLNFVDLIQSDSYDPTVAQVSNGDGEVIDTNGDGNFELVLSHGIGRGPDISPLDRVRTETWAWDGSAVSLTCSEIVGAPVFRFQAFQEADNATECGDYPEALALYQQAVFDEELIGWSRGRIADDSFYTATPTPDPNERPRINAYGRYRIMLLHIVQGHLSEAEVVYNTLIAKFPKGDHGSQYAELATVFWNSYHEGGDLGDACEAAAAYSTGNAEQILNPLGSDFYGFYSRDYTPEDICPLK